MSYAFNTLGRQDGGVRLTFFLAFVCAGFTATVLAQGVEQEIVRIGTSQTEIYGAFGLSLLLSWLFSYLYIKHLLKEIGKREEELQSLAEKCDQEKSELRDAYRKILSDKDSIIADDQSYIRDQAKEQSNVILQNTTAMTSLTQIIQSSLK